MRINNILQWNPPSIVYVFIGLMLFIAVAPMPYGYYTFLRIIVSGVSGFVAYRNFELQKFKEARSFWPWFLVLLSVLFNPLIPIYMKREIWFFINLIVGTLFFFFAYMAYVQERDNANKR